jgi:hypothetical protein
MLAMMVSVPSVVSWGIIIQTTVPVVEMSFPLPLAQEVLCPKEPPLF